MPAARGSELRCHANPIPPRSTVRPKAAARPPSALLVAIPAPVAMISRRSMRCCPIPKLLQRRCGTPRLRRAGCPRRARPRAQPRGHQHPVRNPGRHHPRRPRGPGRARPGQTGSGKTLAFGLPLLAGSPRVAARCRTSRRPWILVPTRELAMQVADVAGAARRGRVFLAPFGGVDPTTASGAFGAASTSWSPPRAA